MSTNQDLTWSRGQTEEWVLTVLQSDGTPDDLSDALAVELEVKEEFNDPDPPLLSLGLSTGITLRNQLTQPGVADVVVSAAQTFALLEGTLSYDVFVTRGDTARKRAIFGVLTTLSPVNFP